MFLSYGLLEKVTIYSILYEDELIMVNVYASIF